VIYHHGTSATGGHYTCDVCIEKNRWMHFDDMSMTPITPHSVVSKKSNQSPYLLLYKRASFLD
jgi:ubiquitin C-terminal hydrolase